MTAPKRQRRAHRRVFVYGTLSTGEPNHGFLATARFVAQARTKPVFRLHDLGPYPALVRGGRQSVEGEVYEVDEATLAVLDRVESHPVFYCRSKIVLEGGDCAEAYLLAPEQVKGRPIIHSGSWRKHRQECRT